MKKAILAVSFGTSYPDTLQRTIAATEEMLRKTFPDWEVRRAFTSGMIIRKLQKRDGVEIDTVTQAMKRLEAEGYETVCVLTGLGEHPAVRALFVEHARQAEQLQAEAC